MALDGITVAALRSELTKQLINGRLYKIAQPENDELLLTIKTEQGETQRLLISAGASLPFLYLTNQNDCSKFLHASQKASSERTYYRNQTAFFGTYSYA